MWLPSEERRECAKAFLVIALLVAVLASRARAAEPMDLSDPRARAVTVRFEISPDDRPGQIDAVYAPPIVAWLAPGARAHEVELTIPGRVVEEQLLVHQSPRPGSFSDFVWIFDARTGHVRSAELSGVLLRDLGWGPVRSQIDVHVTFRMDTLRTVGFRPEGRLLGQRVNAFCVPEGVERCVAVRPSPFDVGTGHVNAVGHVDARTKLKRLQTYSTLGEAIFSELAPGSSARLAAVPD